MSVLRRALRAASDLRDQFDLDAVRETVRSAGDAAGRGDADAAPDAPAADRRRALDDREVVDHARALGAPDPYALVSAEEAAVALGAPAGPARLTHGDDTIGVVVAAATSAGGALSVSAFHAVDDDVPFDASAHWHDVLAPVVADDADAVAGIGRAALRTAGGLYVLGDTHLLYLTLTRPGGAETDPSLGALARAVLDRLEPSA
jgi:hypothetical protein